MGRIKDMGLGVGDYFTPNSVVKHLMPQMFVGMPDSVKEIGKKLLADGWRFYVVSQRCGKCYYRDKVITIPEWVITGINHHAPHDLIRYKCWYICHEMSHALDTKRSGHGRPFMETLKRICPADCVHYELTYKPRNAAAVGIGLEDDDEFGVE